MNSPLILIAASARAIASMACRAGFWPCSIDLFADEDLQRLGPVRQIADFAEVPTAVANFPAADWLYGGAFENHPDLIDQLNRQFAGSGRLLGNDGATVRRVRDPLELQHALTHGGFHFPKTSEKPVCDGRWLRKPKRSGGGHGIRFASDTDQNQAENDYFWQQHIDGLPGSALFVAAAGSCRLLMASAQLLGADRNAAEPFAYVGSASPLPNFATVERELLAIGDLLAAEFGLQGAFGVDFVQADKCVWPVEVNPRLTASAELLLRNSELNPVASHVAACRDGQLPARDAYRAIDPQQVGKAIVFAPRGARAGLGLADHIRRRNEGTAHPAIADIPPLGTIFQKGQPIVTVFAEAHRRDDMLAELRAAAAAVVDMLDV